MQKNIICLLLLLFLSGITSGAIYANISNELLQAVKANDYEKTKELLEKGANSNIKEEKGLTPLIWATRNKNKRIAEILLEYGANINHKSNYSIRSKNEATVVDFAVANRDPEFIDFLRSKGADIHAKNQWGLNAFYLSILIKDTPTIQYFINHNATLEEYYIQFLLSLTLLAEADDLEARYPNFYQGKRKESIVEFFLKNNFVFDTSHEVFQENLNRKSSADSARIIDYLNKVTEELKRKTAEQHFQDSILSLSEAERNSDPNFIYTIKKIHEKGKDGVFRPKTIIEKKPRPPYKETYYIYNTLENNPLAILLTLLYVIAAGTIYAFRRSKILGNEGVIGLLFIFSPIFWGLLNALIFNINELHTRKTGKEYHATVTFYSEEKIGRGARGSRYTYTVYHSTFYCEPIDSIRYIIEAKKTTYNPGGKDKDAKEINIRLNEKREKAAVDISWHTRHNKRIIILTSTTLAMILIGLTGIFNNYIKKGFTKLNKVRKKEKQKNK